MQNTIDDLDTILKPIKNEKKKSTIISTVNIGKKIDSKLQHPSPSDKVNDTGDKKTANTANTANIVDNVLNNDLIKFDNRAQTSSFYVCTKALTMFYNDITQNYNVTLPRKVLEQYITNVIPNLIKEFNGNLKKRCKKNINIETLCLGRKIDGRQCTRKKHIGFEFCKSHLRKLSNGRVDNTSNSNIGIKSKRGRKRKVEFDPRQYDNEYVTLWEDIINDEKVFVDNFNNVYTFDLKAPRFLGKKKLDFNIEKANEQQSIEQTSSSAIEEVSKNHIIKEDQQSTYKTSTKTSNNIITNDDVGDCDNNYMTISISDGIVDIADIANIADIATIDSKHTNSNESNIKALLSSNNDICIDSINECVSVSSNAKISNNYKKQVKIVKKLNIKPIVASKVVSKVGKVGKVGK